MSSVCRRHRVAAGQGSGEAAHERNLPDAAGLLRERLGVAFLHCQSSAAGVAG